MYAILRANQARDMMAGRFELEPRPRRRSKRKRDYWTLFLVGNAGFLAALGLLLRSRPDSGAVIIMVSVGAGQVLFNVALGWVMWVVMDDY